MVCCAELLVSLLVPRLHDPSVEIWSERLNEHLPWQLPHSWRSSWTALQVVLRPWFAMLTLKHSLRQVGGWSTARTTFRSFERVFERAWRTVFEPLLPRLPTLKYRN